MGSVSSTTAADTLLRQISWINRQTRIHLSVYRISGADNKEADAASRLTHLTVLFLLHHFNSSFAQSKPWQLHLLSSAVKHHLCRMPHTKRSLQGSPIPPSVNTTQHESSGNPSVPICASPPISKKSMIQLFSCKCSLQACAQEYKWPAECPFQSEACSNTSGPLGKFLQQWGPNISDTTTWYSSTVVWEDNLWPMRANILPPL